MLSKNNIKPRWKSQKFIYEEGLKYVQGRMKGTITSLMTPWNKLNNATVNGFEWGSMTVIGGRPGTGKTVICDQITIESFALHGLYNHRVLQFQLEMPAKAKAVRSLSAGVKLTYKDLCSVDSSLTEEQFQSCINYAKKVVDYPIDVVDETPTVEEFKQIIRDYMNYHGERTGRFISKIDKHGNEVQEEVISYRNTLITLDHSILVRRAHGQNLNEMLFELGEVCTFLKRVYPIAFIILSQLNRNIDSPERNEEGKYGNYILSSDIYGAESIGLILSSIQNCLTFAYEIMQRRYTRVN